MDSINQQQPENNHADLNNAEAVDRIREIAGKAKSCFFCTASAKGDSRGVRPMSLQKIDDDGSIWFLSSKDSHKNLELENNSSVRLFFQGSSHSDFLYLDGEATISQDKTMIGELWEPVMKTWFTEGEKDPRISVLRFVPKEGYYWDSKHGSLVAGAKMLIGAAVGKTLDDSIEGQLSLQAVR